MLFGLGFGYLNQLAGDHLKPLILKPANDPADQTALYPVRLNHQKRSFHGFPPEKSRRRYKLYKHRLEEGGFTCILPKKRNP